MARFQAMSSARGALCQRAAGRLLSEQIGLDHNNRQGIVQLMCDAGQQGTHGGELLALEERFLLAL